MDQSKELGSVIVCHVTHKIKGKISTKSSRNILYGIINCLLIARKFPRSGIELLVSAEVEFKPVSPNYMFQQPVRQWLKPQRINPFSIPA